MAKKPTLSAAALPSEQKALFTAALAAWSKAAEEAAAAVERENTLRLQLVTTFFPNAGEGTNTMKLEDGRELKADIRINRSIERAQLDGLLAFIHTKSNEPGITPELRARVELLQGIVDRIVAYKPELVQAEYKGLDDQAKRLMGDVVVEKPGTPGLKIHIPPPKK